jgi:hypothetical protein
VLALFKRRRKVSFIKAWHTLKSNGGFKVGPTGGGSPEKVVPGRKLGPRGTRGWH